MSQAPRPSSPPDTPDQGSRSNSVSRTIRVTDSGDKGRQWETMSALLPLLKEAFGDTLKKYEGSYTFVGGLEPLAWDRFQACSASVKTFQVNKDTKDDGIIISPAVLMYLQKKLGSRAFFPNLRSLHVSSISPLLHHAPLFLSPSLKEVTTIPWNKWSKGKKENGEAFGDFLRALADVASGLEIAVLDHPAKVFDRQAFRDILRFRDLRKLELRCLVSLEGINDIRGFSALPHLEEMWLAITWWGWITETTEAVAGTSSVEDPLGKIKRLVLSAPPHIFLEVINVIDAKELECILGECQSKTIWDRNSKELWGIMTKRWPAARLALATFQPSEENGAFSCADAFAPLLRDTLDTKSIWLAPRQASTIFVADPGATMTLSGLRELAESLPALMSLSIAVDLSSVPLCDFKPLRHGLRELTVYETEPEKEKLASKWFDVARYLHCLFPGLEVLQGPEGWKRVWELVEFSQKISMDSLRCAE